MSETVEDAGGHHHKALHATPLRSVMLKSSIWMLVGLFFTRFLGYVFNSLLTKSFSEAEYGFYSLLWNAPMFVATVALVSVGAAVERYTAYYRGLNKNDEAASAAATGFAINLILTLAVIAVFALAYATGTVSLTPLEAVVAAVFFIAQGLNLWMNGVLTGYRRPERTVLYNFLHYAIRVLLVASVIAIGLPFEWALTVMAAAFAVTVFIGVVDAFGSVYRGAFNRGLSSELIRFGGAVTAVVAADNVLSWADIFIIKVFMTSADVGIYWGVWILASILWTPLLAISLIYSPIATELLGSKAHLRLSKLTVYLTDRYVLLFTPAAFFLALWAPQLLRFVYTGAYAEASNVMVILVVGVWIVGFSRVFRQIITSSGKPKAEAGIIIAAAAIKVVLNVLLIPAFGLMGAAYATLIASSWIAFKSYGYARNVVEIPLSFATTARNLFACALGAVPAAYAVYFIWGYLGLALSAVIFAVVWFAAVMLLKLLTAQDVDAAESMLAKARLGEGVRGSIKDFLFLGVRGN
ncbi:Uncharacterised protein [uncultured archaeon]|nr:Uncharacterised protein [uncultured archaeon]